jgi:hypothetical protein
VQSKQTLIKFEVRKSVLRHTIKIIQPTRCKSFTSLLPDDYIWLNMFRASSRPSSGAYNCTRSLWFYRSSLAVGALLVVVYQTTTKNAPSAVVCFWWRVGRRPKRVEPHINVIYIFFIVYKSSITVCIFFVILYTSVSWRCSFVLKHFVKTRNM